MVSTESRISGNRNGGSAIGQAAKQGALIIVHPDIITFSDADYKWQNELAAQCTWDNYIQNEKNVKLNFIVQSTTSPNQKPTKYALEFLKGLGYNVEYNEKKTWENIIYYLITSNEVKSNQLKSTGIDVTRDSKHRLKPATELHNYIGRMSIWWTVTHDGVESYT